MTISAKRRRQRQASSDVAPSRSTSGVARDSGTGPDYAKNLFAEWDPRAIGQIYGTSASDWPFALADLRAYDRAITDEEIVALSQ